MSEKQQKISVDRSVFATLIIALVLLALGFVYIYGNMTGRDMANKKVIEMEAPASVIVEDQTLELQAGVLGIIADDLTDAEEELNSIDVDSL